MSNCPRCNYLLQKTAVSCPQCGTALTAYGHPGIPLYQAQEDTFLCSTCVYELDDTCTFPQRPHAKTCTLYRDSRTPRSAPTRRPQASLKRRYDARSLLWLLGFICLIGIAILLAR
ncbi:zinc ribbon domain-containing protein [Acaryochloris thomasi]|uniref:zinc ribbon domain-containing protein n=1 Tax=Acaryochloris thomasi TaxID=2929456 RepID=UPI000DA65DF4|nr:zinc ribbon domain-containing protein [Acaryochloris thomasi]